MIDLLQERRQQLINVIRSSLGSSLHCDAFVTRIVDSQDISWESTLEAITDRTKEAIYEGYPAIAALGYLLSDEENQSEALFIEGLARLNQRGKSSLQGFFQDDVAVLGVASGISTILRRKGTSSNSSISWFCETVGNSAGSNTWTDPMRDLAKNLLDKNRLMRTFIPPDNIDQLATQVSLASSWPLSYQFTEPLTKWQREALLRGFLLESSPSDGELVRASVWLNALNYSLNLEAKQLVMSPPDIVKILERVQPSLKRWPYENQARRRGASPIRWLIDNEYNVQSLLWAILYPIFGADLDDEVYVEDWGNLRPRIDFGIRSLKTIIEIKIARSASDFIEFEEQIAGDLGIYFKDTNRYDRLIVFVYDDCDLAYPEKYEGLRQSLLQRERVEAVVIMRRPSMIPNREERLINSSGESTISSKTRKKGI